MKYEYVDHGLGITLQLFCQCQQVITPCLQVVGQVISQRCLETGVSEVYLDVTEEDREKEKMVKFIDVIEQSGLSLQEADVFMPTNPHISNFRRIQPRRVKPWTVLEPET